MMRTGYGLHHKTHHKDSWYSKQDLYPQLTNGHHSRDGQNKGFKDTLKASLKKCDVNINTWETQIPNHPKVCHYV